MVDSGTRLPHSQRLALMARWSARLQDQAASHDWQALEATDRELAEVLPKLAALGDWSAEERVALGDLNLAHREARNQCAAASDALQRSMTELQANKDGWLAYALHSNLSESRT